MPSDLKSRVVKALEACGGRCLDDANDRAAVLAEVMIAVSPSPPKEPFPGGMDETTVGVLRTVLELLQSKHVRALGSIQDVPLHLIEQVTGRGYAAVFHASLTLSTYLSARGHDDASGDSDG